ncbi:conserved hypothetical protein [Formosa agariphila KMM 3901]|uniref:Uncharacterized protein n=1 Tax=Formosa agariphila (strain DSM 15362 / KCTC 12365 / LMG 23005 / KMM 3901 / M-2Alg 35-1) TaxID=1347342 RepID=T2KM21_FORAG|nr:hypothetical protein [Formosa agariphila]CDF79481.1 conserved hypothetical protein [Formosa agariphila KMM 3901]
MNHKFYNKRKKEQQRVTAIIAICALAFIILAIGISIYSEIYGFGFLVVIITLSIIAPFFDMPALKKSGRMVYYSPLFISEKPKNGLINIHGGTLFDYYFVIDRKLNGKQRTDFIIQQYLEGLLRFIEANEASPYLKIRGTSYIINERTAEKIGFKIVETDLLQNIILAYNYFNILLSNSIAKNKLAWPNLKNTKTFEADMSQLLERKEYIASLNASLKRTMAKSV